MSNSYAPIIAINFDTIFSRKPSIKEYLTKSKLDRMFVKEYKELTYKLYHKGFNVYIVSFKPIKDLNDTLWGKYLFFNSLVEYDSLEDLAFDCKNVYSYYIDSFSRRLLLENSYTLEEFKEQL